MKHCVASYKKRIEQEKRLILRYEEDIFYTVEVRKLKKEYFIAQMMKKYNEHASKSNIKYLENVINNKFRKK